MISCGARLAPFDIPQLREVMAYDELELDRIGDRKTAVFFIISDTTQTYNFLVALEQLVARAQAVRPAPIKEQMAEAAKQAGKENAARPAPAKAKEARNDR